jgi:hypothetical protein
MSETNQLKNSNLNKLINKLIIILKIIIEKIIKNNDLKNIKNK